MQIKYALLVLFISFTHRLFSMENAQTQIAAIEKSLNEIPAHYSLYLTQKNNSEYETFKKDYFTTKLILMRNLSLFFANPASQKDPKALDTLFKPKIKDLKQIEFNCNCSEAGKLLLSTELSNFVKEWEEEQ